MFEPGGGSGLAQEALPGGGAGRQARQDSLEGHLALQQGILGLEYDAHTAGTQHFQDPVGAQPAHFVGLFGGRQEVVNRRLVHAGRSLVHPAILVGAPDCRTLSVVCGGTVGGS